MNDYNYYIDVALKLRAALQK